MIVSEHREFVGEAGGAADCAPLPGGQRDDHHAAAVRGREIAPETAVQIVADRRPRGAVDMNVADIAEMPDCREHHVAERRRDLLPLAGAGAVPLGGEHGGREIQTRRDVPGRQDMIDRQGAGAVLLPVTSGKPLAALTV